MCHYHIISYHFIIISIIIIPTIANPAIGNIYEKPSKYFTYKNEPDNYGFMPEEYFNTAKRSRNSYSWMSNSAIKSQPRNMLFVLEKPAPLNPYSWQYMMKKKNQIILRNPYSWMNNHNN
uniref:Bm13334 n=1 Tax=Brugia malayi TaxID=6279 RepID=A0A0J9YBF8_BRUMA|nr:Bm13334 [Brugia malayi]